MKALPQFNLRRAVLLLVLFLGLSAIASAQGTDGGASSVSTALGSSTNGYITLGIKIFGGLLTLGGFVVAFNGFTGREEGFDKVFKIGTGLLGIGLGVLCIGQTPALMSWLSLTSVFAAS